MSALLEKILKLHLHPETGTPYWLDKQRELGFSICKRIQSIDNLHELGPFDLQALVERPFTDFIPRAMLSRNTLIIGETGGATGAPKTTVYFEHEFHAAFVEPFLSTCSEKNTFNNGYWLWLGPNGPHIIGKAARQIAQITTGSDVFSVDFDPRWYRSLTQGTVARKRYLDHLVEQAIQIIRQQNIRYLFSTPVMLVEMIKIMEEEQKQAIEFIYLGGMSVAVATMNELGDAFPNAQFLSGYGNTLFGVCHELAPHRSDNQLPTYFPPAERIGVRLVSMDVDKSDSERLRNVVAYGERGQVVMHRLDQSCFLANVMERDSGIRVVASGDDNGDGIRDPQPMQTGQFIVENGIY